MGKDNKLSFFEQNWMKYTGIVGAAATMVGIGFYCGDYKASIQCDKEQIKMIQEYNEKLTSDENLCKTQTILGIREDVKELKEVTNYLKKKKNEK